LRFPKPPARSSQREPIREKGLHWIYSDIGDAAGKRKAGVLLFHSLPEGRMWAPRRAIGREYDGGIEGRGSGGWLLLRRAPAQDGGRADSAQKKLVPRVARHGLESINTRDGFCHGVGWQPVPGIMGGQRPKPSFIEDGAGPGVPPRAMR